MIRDFFSLCRKALAIGLVSILLAAAVNWLRPESLPWQWQKPAPSFPVINELADFDAALKDPALVLVDARLAVSYAAGHVPGALSLPVDSPDEALADFVRALPRDARVIVYCSDPLCHMAEQLAERLAEHALRPTIFTPGFDLWSEAARPVEMGPAPKPGGKETP